MIIRYNPALKMTLVGYKDTPLFVSDTGDFVKYTDHLEEVRVAKEDAWNDSLSAVLNLGIIWHQKYQNSPQYVQILEEFLKDIESLRVIE